MKRAAMRWLRGEFHSKTEARRALGGQVRVMINDETWYDNIKLIAYFARQARYRGLLIFIDETVHLSRISHAGARNNNYMRLLSMLNDTLQGNADYLGIYLGATPDALEDPRRGFYNNEALESRLRDSRFSEPDFRDLSGPVVRLDTCPAPSCACCWRRCATYTPGITSTSRGSARRKSALSCAMSRGAWARTRC